MSDITRLPDWLLHRWCMCRPGCSERLRPITLHLARIEINLKILRLIWPFEIRLHVMEPTVMPCYHPATEICFTPSALEEVNHITFTTASSFRSEIKSDMTTLFFKFSHQSHVFVEMVRLYYN